MARKNSTTNLRISVVPGGAASNSTGKAAKANKQNGKKKGRKPRGGSNSSQRMGSSMVAYQRMIADPCNSPLVPGLYGTIEGYLSRFHSVISIPSITINTLTSGVILWCPKFHSPGRYGSNPSTVAGTSGAEYNLITSCTNSTTAGLNLTGYGVATETFVSVPGATYNDSGSLSYPDPAWNFVNGATCSSARTLSACIKMSYFGQMATTQGMVCQIDIPLSQVVDSLNDGSGASTLTIDSLFAGSQLVSRTKLDTAEQKWIPSEDGVFMSATSAAAARDIDLDYMVRATRGATPPTTSVFTTGTYAQTNNPRVIGFAWRGFAAGNTFPLQFDLYKNIDWKPEALSGITVPRSVRVAVVPPVQSAVTALDSKGKSWTQEVMHEVESVASSAAKTALAFSGQLVRHAVGLS